MKTSLSIALLLILFSSGLFAQTQSLTHDGNLREYVLYVPPSYDPVVASPLLFNFHGGGGTAAFQAGISNMQDISDSTGLIVVYPQAWPDPGDGGSTNWTHKEPTTHDDIFFVEAMIDTLAAQYNIDASRVYACGYSNGGEFSFELACRLSDRIAAIGVVARSMFIDTYDECSPSHPTAVMTIHGTDDDYEGIVFGGVTYYVSLDTVNAYWSSYNNTDPTPLIETLPDSDPADGSTVERYSWENGDGCVSVEHLKVLAGGHDWPGTFGNMDIDADVEIWNFVSRFNKDGLIDCDTTSTSTAIGETAWLVGESLSIYPNPVQQILTIETNLLKETAYQIYNATGKLVRTGTVSQHAPQIDVSDLAGQLYLLKIGSRSLRFLKE